MPPLTRETPIAVLGAGAFGTALAIALARAGRRVTLWGRPGPKMAATISATAVSGHLSGAALPDGLEVTDRIESLPHRPGAVLLAVPTQTLRGVLAEHGARLGPAMLVACCKGVERGTGLLPTQIIEAVLPGAPGAVLTGPSFAADIIAGRPTALTLATKGPQGEALQAHLSTPTLRLYLGDDPMGAQLGGALKNVIAIAAGITIGAGLGDSARSALMTRGFAEMVRFAAARGARRETLFGLSGFGDLVLTCTSAQSRNLRHGLAIGEGREIDPSVTVEGVMTAHAVAESAGEDLPVTRMVSALLGGQVSLEQAVEALLSRPLRREADPL